MQFLNDALLVGALAFSVPLIIHLLNRSRYRTVEWGAMHLLESVVATNSRRLQLEQLLLLLLRCAIPILLALCLAMPVLTGAKSLPGDAPASTVILLDNSYSMDAPGESGTRINEAKRDAKTIIDAMGKGSDISVILTGGSPSPLLDTPVFDTEAITGQLGFLESGRGSSQWSKSLQLGATLLSGMSHARRNLILISDFQSQDIETLSAEQLQRFKDQTKGTGIETSVTMIQRTGETASNLAVESVEQSAEAVGINQTLKLRARVRNYGKLAATDVRLQLKVNDQLVDEVQIEVAGEATSQALFTHRFDEPGSNVLEIQMNTGDDVPSDDRFRVAVDVLKSIRVLLIDGDPRSIPMESETDFLNVALTPFQSGRMKLSDLVETRVLSPSEISEAMLGWPQVVVMTNVAQLDDAKLGNVRDFVNDGGGLILFMGNRVNAQWYNRVLFEKAGLLPMPLRGVGGGPRDEDPSGKIVAQHFDHPSLQIFNKGNSELTEASVRQWYRFGQLSDTQQQDAASDIDSGTVQSGILMKLDNGDPLLVESTLGRGAVLACATSADAEWSNLPLRPVFVPLVQQLVTGIATRGMPATNLSTGETLVAYLPSQAADSTQVLSLPNEKQKSVRAVIENESARAVVRYENTASPGVYSLTQPGAPPLYFAVESDRSESSPETLDGNALREFAEKLGADIVADGETFLELDATRRHGREVWRWVLLAFVVLLFGELLLQQKLSRVRA